MQHPFVSLWEKPSRLVVGRMSGRYATVQREVQDGLPDCRENLQEELD